MGKFLSELITVRNFVTVICASAVIGVLLQLDSCRNSKFKHQQGLLDSATLANQKLVQDLNRAGEVITSQQMIITQDKETLTAMGKGLLNLSKSDERRIKQIDELIKLRSNTVINNVPVPFVDLTERKRFSDSVEKACKEVITYYDQNYIPVPTKVKLDTPYLKFRGTVTKNNFTIDTLLQTDSTTIAVVETKGGILRKDINGKLKLFSRSSLEIKVKEENPYREIVGLTSIKYKPKTRGRWGERAILLGLGVLAAKTLFK